MRTGEIGDVGGGDGRTGVDGVGVLVGDLDAEFLLDGHDDFDGVEGVEAEVVGEVGDGLDLRCVRVEIKGVLAVIGTYVGDIVDLGCMLA